MSVVVRMEMPKGCWNCPCVNGEYGYCQADKDERQIEDPNERPSWCPIICQLPEVHGRLVDADALADDVRSLWDYKTVDGITATTVLNQTLTDIRNCPTIVPAERSET